MITVLDSTLRDGAQAEGISFSLSDKLNIIASLDALHIHYIEAGNPYSNPKDKQLFSRAQMTPPAHSKLVAFTSTCRKGCAADGDEGLISAIAAQTPAVCVFGKSARTQVERVLETSEEENLRLIRDSVRFLKERGREVLFDAEHFFSGCLEDARFAFATVEAAAEAGADIITLCDTTGGAFPKTVEKYTRLCCKALPGVTVGIHAHNDCGLAVANTLAAVDAGATHIQGTFLGIGERCGNAALSCVIPDLQLKLDRPVLPEKSLPLLTGTALFIAEISNISLPRFTPYVGRSAFSHKGGMHVAAVLKDSATFEHIDPAAVGNERHILISEVAGRSTLFHKLKGFLPDIDEGSPQVKNLLAELKRREAEGFQYEGAQASFELFVRKSLSLYTPFYELVNFKVINEQPAIPGTSAMAMVKIGVNGEYKLAAAEGVGPVNAMDKALRSALCVFYPQIARVHLTDFKVRVLDAKSGTDVSVRVVIDSTDGAKAWTTVGVSADIIEASYMALADSIEYKLLSDGCNSQD